MKSIVRTKSTARWRHISSYTSPRWSRRLLSSARLVFALFSHALRHDWRRFLEIDTTGWRWGCNDDMFMLTLMFTSTLSMTTMRCFRRSA